jgi:hypothetical protein
MSVRVHNCVSQGHSDYLIGKHCTIHGSVLGSFVISTIVMVRRLDLVAADFWD